ncbi:DUF4184 family protein [archaeon]|nr:MAG: DUF4184 family protein [archaeon]
MFTLLHPFAGFALMAPIRKRLNLIAFFLGAMLPDLEGLYFISASYNSCAAFIGSKFTACAADYPSHFLLHSLLGAVLIGLGIVAFFIIASRIKLFRQTIDKKLIFISSVAGTLSHLFVDLFFHGGADALALFYPLDWRPSLAFFGLRQFWILIAYAGIALFAYFYIVKKERLFGDKK